MLLHEEAFDECEGPGMSVELNRKPMPTEKAFRSSPLRLVGKQAALVALLVAVLFLFADAKQSLSGFWGGLVVIVPNVWFAWAVQRSMSATRVVLCALAKFIFVLIGMGLVLVLFDIAALGFFLVLGLGLLAQFLAPIFENVMSNRKSKAQEYV